MLDILIHEGNSNNTLFRSIDILTIDLPILAGWLAGVARKRTLGDLVEHGPQFGVHIGEPGGVAVGVCIAVIEEAMLHHIVALRVGQSVIGFTQMPLAGEVGLVAGGFHH